MSDMSSGDSVVRAAALPCFACQKMRPMAASTATATTMIAFVAALIPCDTFSCAFVSSNFLLGGPAGSDATALVS